MTERSYVLLLEDEEAIRNVLKRWLESWGYAVVAVGNADDALTAMMDEPAAVVIADILMPGHDGLWLTEQIRERWPHIPVIIESGLQNDETIRRALKLGAVDFLPKPFGRETLYQALMKATAPK